MPRQPSWLLVHVPHASTVIPPEVRSQFALSDAELEAELARMTDHYTDKLFNCQLGNRYFVQAPVSRLVVDVERFEDDAREPMTARGMGAVYMATADGKPLRHPLTGEAREALLRDWYRRHHDRLTKRVDELLNCYGRALIVDAHSFPRDALPYEDASAQRPEICIGTDPFHTPPALRDAFVEAFTRFGFEVAVDTPFAGALVPAKHYRTTLWCAAVMIEVRRDLYLDDSGAVKPEAYLRLKHCIADAIVEAAPRGIGDLRNRERRDALPQALTPDELTLAAQIHKEKLSHRPFYAKWTDEDWRKYASSRATSWGTAPPD
jgi:N-formylglutamate amidohydrolase